MNGGSWEIITSATKVFLTLLISSFQDARRQSSLVMMDSVSRWKRDVIRSSTAEISQMKMIVLCLFWKEDTIKKFIYNKTQKKVDPVKVDVSTSILNVIDISEVNHIIELKFDIVMEWYEYRASYHNLKNIQALNKLSEKEVRMLWIPYIIFQNTDDNKTVVLDGVRSTVFINRESEFQRSGIEIADEIEIFSGDSNKLTISQTYSKKFHCTYLLHYFPFDTQVH